jgi:cell division protein FtsB
MTILSNRIFGDTRQKHIRNVTRKGWLLWRLTLLIVWLF